MRTKVRIDMDHDNRPIIKLSIVTKLAEDEEMDVRDKLADQFTYAAYQVKGHTAFDGIAGKELIRHGFPCMIEYWSENDYVIKPIDNTIENLEMLKKYIDSLINYEKRRNNMVGDNLNFNEVSELSKIKVD